MLTINIHEAKTHLTRFVDQSAAGEEIIIARARKPGARLVSLSAEGMPRRQGLGGGKFNLSADFDTIGAREIERMFEAGE
jgi:antitoxin (DNA-binding transcriptional repressor) of toxin-antitoxin stability system